MPIIPDIVRLSKLSDTSFSLSPEYTQHVQSISEPNSGRRLDRREERWSKNKRLGRGTYGDVWLQQCIYGHGKGKVRAVKEIPKEKACNYHSELEAIALFSHKMVSI